MTEHEKQLQQDATALRTAARMLFEGMGPDMCADSDETYGHWLLQLADRLDPAKEKETSDGN